MPLSLRMRSPSGVVGPLAASTSSLHCSDAALRSEQGEARQECECVSGVRVRVRVRQGSVVKAMIKWWGYRLPLPAACTAATPRCVLSRGEQGRSVSVSVGLGNVSEGDGECQRVINQ